LEVAQVVGVEDGAEVVERGVEDQNRRDGGGVGLRLERSQEGPEDREEHEQGDRVGQQVEREGAGTELRPPDGTGERDRSHAAVPDDLNVRVSRRRSSAAMIALRMIASTPWAEDVPTSFAWEIVW